MRFKGQVFFINCDKGGVTYTTNIDLAKPEAMVYPTRNINMDRGGREKRGGTSKINGTAITGGPHVECIFDYTPVGGAQNIVMATDDGKIWKDFSTTIKTGLTASQITSMEVFGDELFICNGADTPQTWDGAAASTSNITSMPTDWATVKPIQFIKHGRGVSERLWAIMGNKSVYASENGDGQDFSDANVIKINIETGDGTGIIGGFEFGDRLVVMGKRNSYLIDDEDPSTANWGYQQAQWNGGCGNHRLIVKTPNDVIVMANDGEIYSILAVEQYGDYKLASVSRQSFIQEYIKDWVDLTKINEFHAVYDPAMRAIKIFVIKQGNTTVGTALVYFIDRGPEEGWTVHDNQEDPSGYTASCSAVVEKTPNVWKVYTGDYSGFVWELETSTYNDDGVGYYGGFKTPRLDFTDPTIEKLFFILRVTAEPDGHSPVQLRWWLDDVEQTQTEITLSEGGHELGVFLLGTDDLHEHSLTVAEKQLGNRGKRVQFEIYNSTINESFFVTRLQIYFTPLGIAR